MKVEDVGFVIQASSPEAAMDQAVRCTVDYLRKNSQDHWKAMVRLKYLSGGPRGKDSGVDCPDPDEDAANVRLTGYDVGCLRDVLDSFRDAIGLSDMATSMLRSAERVLSALEYDEASACYGCACGVAEARAVVMLLELGRMDDISVYTMNAMSGI